MRRRNSEYLQQTGYRNSITWQARSGRLGDALLASAKREDAVGEKSEMISAGHG